MANVMIIDDGIAETAALERMLEWNGHHAFVVRDPRAVGTWLDRVRPDMILLDADVPGMDAIGLIGAICTHPAQRDVPVCVYAARADETTIGRALRAGARQFILTGGRDRVGRVGACVEEHLGAGVVEQLNN